MTEQELLKIKELVGKPQKVAIIMHKSPDGDAVGSSLAMYHFLKKSGHTISVLSPDPFPDFKVDAGGKRYFDPRQKTC